MIVKLLPIFQEFNEIYKLSDSLAILLSIEFQCTIKSWTHLILHDVQRLHDQTTRCLLLHLYHLVLIIVRKVYCL